MVGTSGLAIDVVTLLVELVGVLRAPVLVVHVGQVVQPVGHFHVHRVIRVQVRRQVIESDVQRLNVLLSHR